MTVRDIYFLSKTEDLPKDLMLLLLEYQDLTDSTGCDLLDHVTLYNYIIKNKPKLVLELGTGISTVTIGYALRDIGVVYSMEENDKYYNKAIQLLPSMLDNVYIVKSKCESIYYKSLDRLGKRYIDKPEIEYDFVFVDGPRLEKKEFDADIFDVLVDSKNIDIMIDGRKETCAIYKKLFGKKASYINHIGWVLDVSKKDINSNDT